jgi:hypothetical protein
LGKIGYGHFQLNNKVKAPRKKVIKSKYFKNIAEDDIKKGIDEEMKKNEKTIVNFRKKSERDKRIFKIINLMKNEFNDKQTDKSMEPLSIELIDEKTKLFTKIPKKTESQLNSMTKSELINFCKDHIKIMDEIENFIKNNFEDKDNFNSFDPIKEREDEIKAKLKYINNKIQEISSKYNNNNISFENSDKIIQKLKNENHLLKKRLKENKEYKKYKSKTINNLNKTSHHYQLKTSINNYVNSNLTTTSSNGGYIIPSTSRRLTEEDIKNQTIEKNSINIIDNSRYNNGKLIKKRPISSINRINPYYMVTENL